ncbi:hypothetical protein [Sigmofec virus UA08Rod_5492]|uniref:Uncharacterized protein n=1 Tax=Sigmofec virus UA08Rod_5492 TaxID=2929426 RepID=A0A976R7C6_9VIRU|nr:hypothetical protein [Sigmofec virus UA08Rod_5492]
MKTYILKIKTENGKWETYTGIESRSAIDWAEKLNNNKNQAYIITETNGMPLSAAVWNELLKKYTRVPNAIIAKMKESWYNEQNEQTRITGISPTWEDLF